jgi:hypothetical protein
MSAALRAQQEALVSVLFARTAPAHRGLQAYRSNGHALAERALAAAYPVVAALLGEDNFRPLAHELWVSEPPRRGDLAQWGEAFAPFIERLPQLAREEPYLADVARVEWQLHRAATEADRAFDRASFELLAQRDPSAITLQLAPGAACVASPHPVASIVLAHRGELPFEIAGERLRDGVAETALVWRCGLAPRVRIARAGEGEFLAALQEGRALADALQAAPQFDFGAWLAPAALGQLLLGVRPL